MVCSLQGTQEVTMVNNPVSGNSEAHFTGRDCPGALPLLLYGQMRFQALSFGANAMLLDHACHPGLI